MILLWVKEFRAAYGEIKKNKLQNVTQRHQMYSACNHFNHQIPEIKEWVSAVITLKIDTREWDVKRRITETWCVTTYHVEFSRNCLASTYFPTNTYYKNVDWDTAKQQPKNGYQQQKHVEMARNSYTSHVFVKHHKEFSSWSHSIFHIERKFTPIAR